jgi:hypothetical protein
MSKILGLIMFIVGGYAAYILAIAPASSGLPLASFIKGLSGIITWIVVAVLIIFGLMILFKRRRVR